MQPQPYDLSALLQRLNIEELNEMQLASLEANAANENVVLLSPTGSGKTLAFLLPLMDVLSRDKKETQALIIVPSRELAQQIEGVFRQMGTGLKVTSCYGGHLRETEENNLIEPPALIIGTPGRLGDHIRRGNITTDSIETLVLDEFDKSLESGFEEEVAFAVKSLKNIKKRILTSATESVSIPEFVGMPSPVKLNYLSLVNEDSAGLEIQVLNTPDKDKLESLFRLICMVGSRSAIIFCNHRESVERTSEYLHDKGIINEYYHGALEQQERDSALCKFRNGTVDVLVTTDLASRGLDIPNIRYIIHYHLPATEAVFTHRNGRTARMTASGTAILLIGPDEHLPEYISKEEATKLTLPETAIIPDKPKWTTLFIGAGKKDKVNKVDVVGFLSHVGDLKKEDIGLIEVKDFFAFAAIRKSKASYVLHAVKGQKIKNKKVRIDIAK